MADAWQHAGVGARLLQGLESGARLAGVTRLDGDVLAINRKALGFMLRQGFSARPNREEARLVRVSKML